MNNYGYRAIPARVNGIAGTIQRGSIARGQRKGQNFVHNGAVDIVENRVNGKMTSVTVLDIDGRARARLYPDALY